MDKTLFGLIPNEMQISGLIKNLEAAHMHDISLLKVDVTSSRGSMDEQRHMGDIRHHKYEEKTNDKKHEEPIARHSKYHSMENLGDVADVREMKSIEVPNLGECQCSGSMEQDLRLAVQKNGNGKSPLCASLISKGLSDSQAHHFENELKSGQILICIHVSQPENLDRAYDILAKEGVRGLSFSHEKAKSY